MNIFQEAQLKQAHYNSRRHFLKNCMSGLGALSLSSMLGTDLLGGAGNSKNPFNNGLLPKAKNVIFLHMAGAPSQLELFDYKPLLKELDGKDCPQSLLEGKRFAFIQGVPKMLGPQSNFKQHGASRAWISDYLPHFTEVADEICFLKAMHTEEFNHAPAQFLMYTGSPRSGRPSMGSWTTYGLGSMNDDLPGFVVLVSRGGPSSGKRIWGSGFLPSIHQGVQCASTGEPIKNLENPKGVDSHLRKKAIDAINNINELEYQESHDPEILTRISQYELAFRMQASVPEVMDIKGEPEYIKELYGIGDGKNNFANNCLLARRLVEKGVRFVQLYDRSWDHHGANEGSGVGRGLIGSCGYVDKAMTGLIKDLKQRGLLDSTLLVWGGEFGRTPMMEARTGKGYAGRDHHGEAFTMWMTGAGIKRGYTHGATDEIGYYGTKGRVHVHDLQATILHQLGLDHEKLTYRFQGRDYRLTDVHGKVVKEILA